MQVYRMNPGKKSLFLLFVMITSTGAALAGTVTYSNDSYSTGDTLTAGDLNSKFNEIKASVNDNDTKSSISAGTGIGITSNQIHMAPGNVSVSAFALQGVNCTLKFSTVSAYHDGASDVTCYSRANVALPDGVTLTGMTCHVTDSDGTESATAQLRRVDLASISVDASNLIYKVDTTSTSGTLSATTLAAPYTDLVQNDQYFYILEFVTTSDVQGANIQLTYCTIAYTN